MEGGGSEKQEEVIRFRSYNTRNGRNGLLKLALCGMDQANIDLGIMQETNITDVV